MSHHIMASLEPFTSSLSSNPGSYLTSQAVLRQQLMAPVATCLIVSFQALKNEQNISRNPHSAGGVAYCPNECISRIHTYPFQGYTSQMLGADGRMSKSG